MYIIVVAVVVVIIINDWPTVCPFTTWLDPLLSYRCMICFKAVSCFSLNGATLIST